MNGRHLAFPFHVGPDGRTATAPSIESHILGEITQLLLTNTGERPFLPTFGGNLRRLVFQGNDDITAGLAKSSVSQALTHWLGHRVKVLALDVVNDDARLIIELTYQIIVSGEQRRIRFERGGGV